MRVPVRDSEFQRSVPSSVDSRSTLLVTSNQLMVDLLGEHDAWLRLVEKAFPLVTVVARGNEITLSGPERDVDKSRIALDELLILVQEGQGLNADRVDRVVGLVLQDVPSPSGVFTETIRVGRGKVVRPKTFGQKKYVDSIRGNTLVFGIGPAGSGKTYLAMACAIEAFLTGTVRRLILARPAVEAGERLGFLPGDLAAKIDPYMRPLYDAMFEMLGPDETHDLMEKGAIEVAPLAYMRGRTLNDAFVVLDEAQNTTPEQMKMFLTRLGFNSKMVITGDVTQIDLQNSRPSGLRVVERILTGVDGVEFTHLSAKDVVRNRIVADIVDAYEHHDANRDRRERRA
ncbi:MAG: PhoH family protein [Actinobacteria bacterium]|nr:PhoH family protein [Actinomycetota bacterium]